MSSLQELILSITPPTLTLAKMSSRERNSHLNAINEIAEGVFETHERKCQFCGFQENGEIVRRISRNTESDKPETSLCVFPENGNPRDITLANLGVACVFCQAANSINTIERPDAWTAIRLPGIPQSYLSWITRSLFLMSQVKQNYDQEKYRTKNELGDGVDDGDEAAMYIILEATSSIMRKLRDARDGVITFPGFQSIEELSQSLIDLSNRNISEYDNRGKLLAGFRIIPTACIDDDWSPFLKYRTLMFEASDYSGIRSFRDITLISRQAYQVIYNSTFPMGDPLKMEEQFGTVSNHQNKTS